MKHTFLKARILLTLVGALSMSSCSFFNTSNGLTIASITNSYDQAGNIIVTITFEDDETDPVTFVIPKGLAGKDGVSIKDIVSKVTDDGNLELTISYSDDSVEDTVLTVPIKEGRGIKECEVTTNDDGSVSIQFTYTDGTQSEVISIPKAKDGVDGKDGNGIASFVVNGPDKSGKTNVTVTFTDSTMDPVTITITDGKDGVGIDYIELDPSKETDTTYTLVIHFTDGYSDELTINKPHATKWYTGKKNPNEDTSLTDAKTGDYYLNSDNGKIYILKSDGTWELLFTMAGTSTVTEKVYYQVVFNPGLGTWVKDSYSDNIGKNTNITREVEKGTTLDLSRIPTPGLSGYDFAGWYTDVENVNSGKFTDMVPVYSDLTLFAKYIAASVSD